MEDKANNNVISKTESIRLNKYLSEAGVCSRREADRWIESGKVEINSKRAMVGERVSLSDIITVNGKLVERKQEKIILAFYKPKGIVCTAEKREKDNVIDFINYPKRLVYAGRLDKDSEGLLIMTNQGELVNQMMRAVNNHEKEYIVTVTRPITEEFVSKMSQGIWLEDLGVLTKKCKVRKTGDRTIRIILTQGLNRQIRRMCEACGYRVCKLVRVRIMNIRIGDLPKGKYRNLTQEEERELYRLLGHEKTIDSDGMGKE